MTTYLLDANVLVALVAHEHTDHHRAATWAALVDSFAICPVVEGALVRFAVRLGASALSVQSTLRAIRQRRGFEFWPDDASYADVDLRHVRGHRQVTDAYLAGLTASRPDAKLATFDAGLSTELPAITFLVPAT